MSRSGYCSPPAPDCNRLGDFPRPAPALNAFPEYLSAHEAPSSNFPGTLPTAFASIKTSAPSSAGTRHRIADVPQKRKLPVGFQ